MKDPKFTQKIQVKYTQSGGAPGEPYAPIYYTVDMQAQSYQQALEFLGNIMQSCKGVITETSITLIEHL